MTTTPEPNRAGSYRLYGGPWGEYLDVDLNEVGCVTYCDDWEQITAYPDPRAPHRGDKKEFFNLYRSSTSDTWFANEAFYATARKQATPDIRKECLTITCPHCEGTGYTPAFTECPEYDARSCPICGTNHHVEGPGWGLLELPLSPDHAEAIYDERCACCLPLVAEKAG